jgi:hypothetical protein
VRRVRANEALEDVLRLEERQVLLVTVDLARLRRRRCFAQNPLCMSHRRFVRWNCIGRHHPLVGARFQKNKKQHTLRVRACNGTHSSPGDTTEVILMRHAIIAMHVEVKRVGGSMSKRRTRRFF